MPISKSAKKSLRSSIAKHDKNIVMKAKLKDVIKKATDKNINDVYSTIDKAAKTHLINRNKASRLKSRLIKKIGSTPKADKTVKTVAKSAKPKKTKTIKKSK